MTMAEEVLYDIVRVLARWGRGQVDGNRRNHRHDYNGRAPQQVITFARHPSVDNCVAQTRLSVSEFNDDEYGEVVRAQLRHHLRADPLGLFRHNANTKGRRHPSQPRSAVPR